MSPSCGSSVAGLSVDGQISLRRHAAAAAAAAMMTTYSALHLQQRQTATLSTHSFNHHSFQPYTATLPRHVDSRYLLSAFNTLDAQLCCQTLFGLRYCKTGTAPFPAGCRGRRLNQGFVVLCMFR